MKNFAAAGDPNGSDLPAWVSDAAGETFLELGDSVGMREEPYLAFYEVMDRMTGWVG